MPSLLVLGLALAVSSLTSCTSCSKTKFKVPREPETAKHILMLLPEGDEALEAGLKDIEAKNDKRFIGSDADPLEQIVFLGWDIINPDGKVDYVTARNFQIKKVDDVVRFRFPDYPRVYFIDFNGNAEQDINKMYMFEDKDEDGDTVDKEFVLVRKPLE
jgi:hypothetical protein